MELRAADAYGSVNVSVVVGPSKSLSANGIFLFLYWNDSYRERPLSPSLPT
jgi:hypothetical protein